MAYNNMRIFTTKISMNIQSLIKMIKYTLDVIAILAFRKDSQVSYVSDRILQIFAEVLFGLIKFNLKHLSFIMFDVYAMSFP